MRVLHGQVEAGYKASHLMAGICSLSHGSKLTALAHRVAVPLWMQVLAVTDAAGVLHLVDLPRMLRRRGQGEVKALEALLEREQQRLAYTQERQATRAKLQKVGYGLMPSCLACHGYMKFERTLCLP